MDFEAMKVQNTKVPVSQANESSRSVASAKFVGESVKTTTAKDYEKPLTNKADGALEEDKAKEHSESEIKSIIKAANEKLSLVGKHFEYKIHNVTKQLMIKVVDSETKEIIKEIPPEKGQDAVAKLWELAGILVDEKR